MTIRPYLPTDEETVIRLWHDCGLIAPQNHPRRDIERKMQVSPEWFLVGEVEGKLVASCMVGYEGHRGWINYLAVHPDHQRSGLARQLMQHAENLLRAVGCPKINLQVRSTNAGVLAFYERIGFEQDAVVSLGKRLEHDQPS